MSDLEYLTGICQNILIPLRTHESNSEWEHEMDEWSAIHYPWPPEEEPDWDQEL